MRKRIIVIAISVLLLELFGCGGAKGQSNTPVATLPDLETPLPEGYQTGAESAAGTGKQGREYILSNGLRIEIDKEIMTISGADVTRAIKDDNRVTQRLADVRTILIQDGVATIDDRAFSDTVYKSIERIEIEGSVQKIGTSAFSGCTNLQEVIVGNSVKTIAASAFSGCTSLQSVTLGDGVESIGEKAFSGCIALNKVVFGQNLHSISKRAFEGCNALRDITLGDSVTSIEDYVFGDCKNLQMVEIGRNLTEVGESIFSGCSNLETIKTRSSIPKKMFENCTSLKTAHIKEGAAVIEERAFSGCTALNSVELEGSIESIGERAFYNCTSLTKIDIPRSVTLVDREAFSGCTALYRVAMEMRGEVAPLVFEDNVFLGCTNIKEIEFVEGVERIGARALEGCENLSTIIIPKSMKKMGERAFNGCMNILHVRYRGNVQEWNALRYSNDFLKAFTGSNLEGGWALSFSDGSPNDRNLLQVGYTG